MNEILQLLLSLSQELKMIKAHMEVFQKTRFQKVGESWIDSTQVMSILRISDQTLRTLRNKGNLPFSKLHSKIFYKIDDVEKLLNKNYTQLTKEVNHGNN